MDKVEYGHCRLCGRKLKSPKAREIGYGPTCLKKKQSLDLIKKDRPRLFNIAIRGIKNGK